MKIFKRLRGFFQRRIPLLRRKKKDKSAKITESCEELGENEISNQVGEFAGEVKVEMNGPLEQLTEEFKNDKEMKPNRNVLKGNNNKIFNGGDEFPLQKTTIFGGKKSEGILPENLKGDSNNDKGMTPSGDEVKENEEISKEGVHFPAQMVMISDEQSPPDRPWERSKKDKRMTSNRDEFKADNTSIYYEGDQVSPKKTVSLDDSLPPDRLENDCKMHKRMTPSKDDFIDVKKEIPRKAVPCPLEKYMLWDGPLVQEWEETFQVDKRETVEKLSSSDDENENAIENRPLLAESSEEELEGLWNPDNNSEFDVDFETAFGKNVKETDAEDPWYYVSPKKVETLGHKSKQTSYHQLTLENEKEIDEQFHAVFGLDVKKYEENYSYDPYLNIFNTHKKEYCNEPVDHHYDFEEDYAEFSDEEKQIEKVQKKKLMAVIRNRPNKNLAFENLFPYSDIDNKMYLREIKDPLKRKDTVRSDLTGFKHLPLWDSSHMKKYYSEGDLSRPPPDFAMASLTEKNESYKRTCSLTEKLKASNQKLLVH